MPLYFDYDYIKACPSGDGDIDLKEDPPIQINTLKVATSSAATTFRVKNTAFMIDMDKDKKKSYVS